MVPGLASDQIPLTVTEYAAASTLEGWSSGGTIIENVPAQAPLGQVWSFLGWSIVLRGFTMPWSMGPGAQQPAASQLGKIIGGLTFAKATPTIDVANITPPPGSGLPGGAVTQPWAEPMLPIPPNTFGMTTIWDGSDPNTPPLLALETVPPTFTEAQGGLVPLITNYALPVPTQIYPGETMQMALWITPSLSTNQVIAITEAAYTVVVDDGQPQITTWGRDLATELAH